MKVLGDLRFCFKEFATNSVHFLILAFQEQGKASLAHAKDLVSMTRICSQPEDQNHQGVLLWDQLSTPSEFSLRTLAGGMSWT